MTQRRSTLTLSALFVLSWRYLWRNYRRTLIMLLAITVGVWAMIFMTALMRGMVDQMIEDGIDALPGLVQIHNPRFRDDPGIDNSMPPPDGALRAALDSDEVAAWTARVKVPSMIASERNTLGVNLLGVDPAGEIALGFDPASVVEGRFLRTADDDGLVVGRKLLERLETGLGKRVVIMSQDQNNDIADRGFRVVGVFEAKLASQEEAQVYAGRETVQSLLGMGDEISEVAVTGGDYRQVEPLLEHLRRAAGPDLEVLPWTSLDAYLGMMLGVMDGFILVWIVVIFLALSFGLVNTLMMAIFERVREIGLMLALGMKPAAILYQVLLESMILLTLGLALGNLLAVATILPLRGGIDLSAVAQGFEMMGASSTLYPALTGKDLLTADLVVIGLGLATSLIPAWRASRYRPVEAIAKT